MGYKNKTNQEYQREYYLKNKELKKQKFHDAAHEYYIKNQDNRKAYQYNYYHNKKDYYKEYYFINQEYLKAYQINYYRSKINKINHGKKNKNMQDKINIMDKDIIISINDF